MKVQRTNLDIYPSRIALGESGEVHVQVVGNVRVGGSILQSGQINREENSFPIPQNQILSIYLETGEELYAYCYPGTGSATVLYTH